MKSALTVVLFRLLTIGVCVDGNEESLSVTVEDSVTLKSGFTERQTDDGIEWRFSGTRIAKINSDSNEIWVKPDGPFKNRLQLDNQTGDLKISNIRTGDSGQYKLRISRRKDPPPEMIFTVKVVPADDVKPLLKGDSVTLLTGLTDIQRNDEILWRFGQQKSLVAEINRAAGIFNTSDDAVDGKFRGRLNLNKQTGSLTITNITTTDSGLYEADIIRTSSRYTIHKTFNVTVSDDVETVSVLKGDSVTLRTGLTETQIIEQIRWMFGDDGELVADLNGPVNKKCSSIDLNISTRDLNISNIQRDQSGDYKVEIINRRMILHRKYQIIMIDAVKSLSVTKGKPVTLPITEIRKDDLILWMFEDIKLAEIFKADQRFFTSDGPDERFRDRLKLDNQTGSLTIRDTRTTHSGLYEVKISSSRYIIFRRINVTVTEPDPDSAVPDQGLSSGAVAWIVVGVLLLAAAAVAGVIYCKKSKVKSQSANEENPTLNGTQNPGDRVNEETELTNAS